MNDCVWSFIFCEGKCDNCPHYISANGAEGSGLLKQYEYEVQEALEPLRKKWEEKCHESTID